MPAYKNIKLIVNYFLGPIVFGLLAWSTVRLLHQQPHWRDAWVQIRTSIASKGGSKIILTLLLMILNWGLEAKKWQWAINPVQQLRLSSCYKAVLAGITIASFTPNRMGEYFGRMLFIEEGKRLRSVSLTMVCSIAQLLVTLWCGAGGLLYMHAYIRSHPLAADAFRALSVHVLLLVLIAGNILLLVFYFRLPRLVNLAEKLGFLAKSVDFVKILQDIRPRILLRILSLSGFRYLVFLTQYYLLFSAFGVELSIGQVFGGMSVMFVIMAILPTLSFLTEIGLRWQVSIQVMTIFSAQVTGIFAVSLGIWLINLIIPALLGSLLILNIKIFKNR